MDDKGRYVDHRDLAIKCRARVDVYNMAGADWLAKHELDCASAINDLISRLEAAEARCTTLDEARENANEACAKWEGMYRMALERAEKAEAEKDSICKYIDSKSELRRYFCESRNDSLEDSNCPSIKKHYSYIDPYDCWKCKQFHNSWAGVKEE